jgi:hypothetical protein
MVDLRIQGGPLNPPRGKLEIFKLGIIDQIVGVENFQPLQFEKTPFTFWGNGWLWGKKKAALRTERLKITCHFKNLTK